MKSCLIGNRKEVFGKKRGLQKSSFCLLLSSPRLFKSEPNTKCPCQDKKGKPGFITVKDPIFRSTPLKGKWQFRWVKPNLSSIYVNSWSSKKGRYLIKLKIHAFEIDMFYGANKGLVVAAVELEHKKRPFKKPECMGEEVTVDPKYYNSRLNKFLFGSGNCHFYRNRKILKIPFNVEWSL